MKKPHLPSLDSKQRIIKFTNQEKFYLECGSGDTQKFKNTEFPAVIELKCENNLFVWQSIKKTSLCEFSCTDTDMYEVFKRSSFFTRFFFIIALLFTLHAASLAWPSISASTPIQDLLSYSLYINLISCYLYDRDICSGNLELRHLIYMAAKSHRLLLNSVMLVQPENCQAQVLNPLSPNLLGAAPTQPNSVHRPNTRSNIVTRPNAKVN